MAEIPVISPGPSAPTQGIQLLHWVLVLTVMPRTARLLDSLHESYIQISNLKCRHNTHRHSLRRMDQVGRSRWEPRRSGAAGRDRELGGPRVAVPTEPRSCGVTGSGKGSLLSARQSTSLINALSLMGDSKAVGVEHYLHSALQYNSSTSSSASPHPNGLGAAGDGKQLRVAAGEAAGSDLPPARRSTSGL